MLLPHHNQCVVVRDNVAEQLQTSYKPPGPHTGAPEAEDQESQVKQHCKNPANVDCSLNVQGLIVSRMPSAFPTLSS